MKCVCYIKETGIYFAGFCLVGGRGGNYRLKRILRLHPLYRIGYTTHDGQGLVSRIALGKQYLLYKLFLSEL